ncbi:hypothetical protein THAOC_37748 [Thalassiosira oceanica]|uniref:Uncharacterized protein n=1 Tax=Thalassiosira oceanica TaxID=159749 RepID=K0RBD2_THAOC|nr:hypothetical protein THAOC_37748 [Thalassiosira oceanica]|eukprot:EJK43772.1 hypothetical protein THAOC_37748 [Thalassiosira oceanica]
MSPLATAGNPLECLAPPAVAAVASGAEDTLASGSTRAVSDAAALFDLSDCNVTEIVLIDGAGCLPGLLAIQRVTPWPPATCNPARERINSSNGECMRARRIDSSNEERYSGSLTSVATKGMER